MPSTVDWTMDAMAPDAQGNIKGIAVPAIPWHGKHHTTLQSMGNGVGHFAACSGCGWHSIVHADRESAQLEADRHTESADA